MAMTMLRHERLLIGVHYAAPPTDDEWERWMQLVRDRDGQQVRTMVEAHQAGGPNAKQRRLLEETVRGVDIMTAVLTDSVVTRGIVTAIAWLNISLRAFAPDQHAAAMTYLGLSEDERAYAMNELPRLRRECGVPPMKRASLPRRR